ncbi:MAG: GAF domain-containing protein [Firmicutes bacterium]|nr:GAF domain-containing protein [Bacillota bacterium]
MYEAEKLQAAEKTEFYQQLSELLAALLQGETDSIANLANASALLYDQMPLLNWAGFYILKDNELVLGPFQGKPACTRIKVGKGVCGTAAAREKTQVVPDVHAFPGHIACDAASRSEIVVPVKLDSELVAVLDLDSPEKDRFDAEDTRGLELFVDELTKHITKGLA